MNKNDLKHLALMGIIGGTLISTHAGADLSNALNESEKETIRAEGNMGYHLMTEDDLKLELNAEGYTLYQSLSEEGKRLARIVASQRCQGTNECAGLNACKTDKNECAGQGACKGQGKCGFSDKNLAVKIVTEKMAKKRKDLTQ